MFTLGKTDSALHLSVIMALPPMLNVMLTMSYCATGISRILSMIPSEFFPSKIS